MAAVFGCFLLADVLELKEFGFALAVAVSWTRRLSDSRGAAIMKVAGARRTGGCRSGWTRSFLTFGSNDRVLAGDPEARPTARLVGRVRVGMAALRPDRGLTVTAILIPEGMAYAQLAGVPAQVAFYAAPAALLLYAMLGSSRQLVVAVSSAVAITSAATISELAPAGSQEYIALTAALAILAGLISLVAGLMRMGRIAQLFSPRC